MPIRVNGGNNPSAVQFNSSSVSAVYFAPDRNADFTQVWGTETAYPSTISVVRAYNSPAGSDGWRAGSYDIYMRDLVYVRQYVRPNASASGMMRCVEYSSQSCSYDFDWTVGEFAGYIFPPSDCSSMQQLLRGTAATITGVPSILSGYDLSIRPDIRWAFDFQYTDYTQSWRKRTTVTLDFTSVDAKRNSVNFIRMDPVSTTLVLDGDTAWCYTATSGLVTERPASLLFSQPL